MRIPFREPTSPRYIHINHKTNRVHLLVPVVGGQEISTDNTCRATAALMDFFNGEDDGALRHLNAYKDALTFDITLLAEKDPNRVMKEERLAQIDGYTEAVAAMRYSYGTAINALMMKPSNLYSIQLRPLAADVASIVNNPAFTIERRTDAAGKPLSPLYNAMQSTFPKLVPGVPDPRSLLTRAVLSALPSSSAFETIQHLLKEQCQQQFGLEVDFTSYFIRIKNKAVKQTVNQKHIDDLMSYDNVATPADYIDLLLNLCAEHLWISIPTPPFYRVPNIIERTEQLSILSQFFLANVTVYCRAKAISSQNFGAILDASPSLSEELVSVISSALNRGDEVEDRVCHFFKDHKAEFGLSRALRTEEITAIKQKFARTYQTVTATKENPHMDDFLILDTDATGESAKFITHQGSICVDFAEIVDPALPNQHYFEQVRADFANHPIKIPQNQDIADGIEIEPEALLARLTEEQFEILPQTIKDMFLTHPAFHASQFLHKVAKGKQDEVEATLTATPANTQTLLRTPGVFTDYSGRTFNCTAYEYAWWAKDTHMRHMLEQHMDEETKAMMLQRIDEIECTGLPYQQHGVAHRSAHFDFTPLKAALQRYLDVHNIYESNSQHKDEMIAAWMDVGKAQRDVPVHVAQEYCRPDRTFKPIPAFNEATLPRVLKVLEYSNKCSLDSWFPLATSTTSGLGSTIAITAAIGRGEYNRPPPNWNVARGLTNGDHNPHNHLAAICRLDEARTADLVLSHHNLTSSASSPGRFNVVL